MKIRIPEADVRFECADPLLQRLYDKAAGHIQENLHFFGADRVLVEGAGYEKIWLETQPMGGEAAFFHCPEAALNNTLLFMQHQREDGRLPGSIACVDGKVIPQYNKLQGFCFAEPALSLYYLTGRDREYLLELRSCLERFDRWLQKTRSISGNGILSSFCVYDTGEDNALRYGDAPCYAPEDEPPRGNRFVPMQSMDITSFSCSCRDTLARIAKLLGEEETERKWKDQADDIRRAIRKHLWNEQRGACFDRYADGSVCDVLCHNNLRCMYWRSFDREMARRFAEEHLLSEAEFMTPMPLTSVAANDPLFANRSENNWSGQPEGLTFQRAIDALENYGYDALVPVLGQKLFDAVIKSGYRFSQQYDPFTCLSSSEKDGYGPTVLSVLEYMNRMHGIDFKEGRVRFSDIGGRAFRSQVELNGVRYAIESDGKQAFVRSDKKEYAFDSGSCLFTDEQGQDPAMLPLSFRG